MKTCKQCNNNKSNTDFYKNKTICKSCLSEKIICSICGNQISRSGLPQHNREVHNEKVKKECPSCNKIFNKSYFKHHECN